MADSIGFALIGCGKISRKHIHVLNSLEDTSIVSVFDVDRSRAEKAAAQAGGALIASSLEEALSAPGVQVATICTPSGTHYDVAIRAAAAHKHVVVEKPMALTLDEADEMIDACDAAGVKLFVVKQNRYNRPVQATKRAIDAGRLGRIYMGGARVLWHRTQEYYDSEPWRGTWAYDGGVCSNQASHHLDLLLWLMGDVVSVFAVGSTVMHDIETEDTATVLLRFRHGAMATLQATTCTQPRDLEGSISLFGTKGTIEIAGFAANELRTWMLENEGPEDDDVRRNWARNPDEFAYNHREFYKDVLQTIRSGRRALIDGIEGRRSLELIHAIYESMETEREVALRFEPHKCKLGIERRRNEHTAR